MTEESIALIREDVAYQVKARYTHIILWEELQLLHPKQLKVCLTANRALPRGPKRMHNLRFILFLIEEQSQDGGTNKAILMTSSYSHQSMTLQNHQPQRPL
jgi:hypothetical protein